MKILAIGDPHGDLRAIRKIPLWNIDLILLTGDLGKASLAREMAFENIRRKQKGLPEKEYSPSVKKKAFMEAYDSSVKLVRYLSQHAPVYTIYGNVESTNPEIRKESKKIGLKLPFLTDRLNSMKGVRVINNRVANFNKVRIGGLQYFVDTNWVREFKPKDYRESLESSREQTDKAKKVLRGFGSLDILVCHQPPYGVLDKVTAKFAPEHWKGKHAGSKVILDYVRKYKPGYVLCGHIHEGEGSMQVGKTKVYNLGMGGYCIIEG
ncbi:MAG: metallophosphoesterase [Candidatus Pacearchaeota archaeon]